MNYDETIEFLYDQFPEYQKVGNVAYKPGLGNIVGFDEYLGHPHTSYKCIHVAGTNGKGSVSHSLAAVLQANGYKVGLYTSPHLKNFTERIRVDGQEVTRDFVCQFVERNFDYLRQHSLSFFEVTTGMAFEYFKCQNVDYAVFEVGLGGRLDSTNVITPVLSVITNIGLDHTAMLGNTLAEIAAEKGGIIKPQVPVVVGERDAETDTVFERIAQKQNAEIWFAPDYFSVVESVENEEFAQFKIVDKNGNRSVVRYSLTGLCQQKNVVTVLTCVEALRKAGVLLRDADVADGLRNVQSLTKLVGRWQKIASDPTVIIDTGHNAHAVRYVAEQLRQCAARYEAVHIVWGMSSDKHPENVLRLLPQNAHYYFTQADTHRAVPADDLCAIGNSLGMDCRAFASVREAYDAARRSATPRDMILVGGSNFVVAEIL